MMSVKWQYVLETIVRRARDVDRSRVRGAVVAVALGSALCPMLRAADQTRTFNNGTNNWSNSNAWSPTGVPNNGTVTYDAVFNGVMSGPSTGDQLTLNINAVIQRLTMTGGQFFGPNTGGPFTLTLNDSLVWSGGLMGRETVVAKGGGTIANNSAIFLGTGTLENQGQMTYAPTFTPAPSNQIDLQFRFGSNGVLINRSGGTFDIVGNGGISVQPGTGARIDNQGMWIKSAGTGTSQILPSFNNTGTVRVQSGTLEFLGGFTQHSASVEASAGAALMFTDGVHTFQATAILGGEGSLEFAGEVAFSGTLLGGAGPLELRKNSQTQFQAGANLAALGVAGASGRAFSIIGEGSAGFDTGVTVSFATLSTNNNFTLNSNQSIFLAGGDNLALVGRGTWTGGSVIAPISGAVKTLAISAPLSISGAGMALDHRKLQNNSTITWNGGYIQAKRNASIENLADATFDIRTDTRIEWYLPIGSGAPTFNNAGLLIKSAGAGEAEFNDVRLMNTGTVLIQSGTLRLDHSGGSGGGAGHPDTGVNSGVYEVGDAGTMWVTDHTMDAASTVRGAGTMAFSGNNNPVAGAYNVTGQTVVYGGLLFEPGAVINSVGQTLDVTPSGGVTFNSGKPVTLNNLILNGTLDGSDSITVTGAVSGTGTLAAANILSSGVIAPGNSPGILNAQGNLSMQSTSKLNMELGGNFNDLSAQDIRYDVLNTAGTLTLNGDLVLMLINGYIPAPGDSLEIITANAPLSQAFGNVWPGQRLTTVDGRGSFVVNYGDASPFGSSKVVLNNFQAIPEPGAITVLSLCTVLLLHRRTRVAGPKLPTSTP